MNLRLITKGIERFFQDNSPAILTGIGVTGVLSVAYLTGTATFKAAEILEVEQKILDVQEKSHPMNYKESAQLVWKLYIPAASVGVATISCIILANRVGTRRASAMAAAYSISEKAFSEYRDKVIEKMGANKEQKARDELAQERVRAHPTKEVIITTAGDVLCYDTFSGRYFRSSVEAIKKAMNEINYDLLLDGYASLGDFYDKIGLPQISMSEELGWTSDKLLEIYFSTSLSDDNQPCVSLDVATVPIRGYYKQ